MRANHRYGSYVLFVGDPHEAAQGSPQGCRPDFPGVLAELLSWRHASAMAREYDPFRRLGHLLSFLLILLFLRLLSFVSIDINETPGDLYFPLSPFLSVSHPPSRL